MSQLSQNVPTHYLKISELPPEGKFACRNKYSWRIIPLAKSGLCGNMRNDWIYAKLCGKYQNMRKCAVNMKLCEKLRKMTNCAISHPPHMNVALMQYESRPEIIWRILSNALLSQQYPLHFTILRKKITYGHNHLNHLKSRIFGCSGDDSERLKNSLLQYT